MTDLLAASKPLVDWAGLGKVFVLAAVFGVGIAIVMSVVIKLQSLGETAQGGARLVSRIGAVIGLLIVIATVIFGIYIMMKK